MQIGEASVASGCHIETIRYYERVGLLPRARRTGGGYRVYTPAEVDRLRFIARGRELGFSLDEIRSLLALAEDASLSCAEVDQLAHGHLAEIRQRVRALKRMARELEKTIQGCGGGERAHCAILSALQTRPALRSAGIRNSASEAGPVHRQARGAI